MWKWGMNASLATRKCQLPLLLLLLINISNNSTSVVSLVLRHLPLAELTTVINNNNGDRAKSQK